MKMKCGDQESLAILFDAGRIRRGRTKPRVGILCQIAEARDFPGSRPVGTDFVGVQIDLRLANRCGEPDRSAGADIDKELEE
jgi:hypothetical protein